MPPPSGLPGTPTTPGYGSVTKKQRVGMDVDGEEPTQAKAGIVNSEEAETGEEKVEEGVKEVTEGVREVEITSQATETEPTKSETATGSSEAAEAPTSATEAANQEETTEEAVPVTEVVEQTTAAAVPLPEFPVLQAQVQASAIEPGEISTELNTDGVTKSANATGEKADAPADTLVPSSIQPAEDVEETKEEKADSVAQA